MNLPQTRGLGIELALETLGGSIKGGGGGGGRPAGSLFHARLPEGGGGGSLQPGGGGGGGRSLQPAGGGMGESGGGGGGEGGDGGFHELEAGETINIYLYGGLLELLKLVISLERRNGTYYTTPEKGGRYGDGEYIEERWWQ